MAVRGDLVTQVQQGLDLLRHEADSIGQAEARKVWAERAAANGALSLVYELIREECAAYGDVLCSELKIEDVNVARGSLIGLRGLWSALMSAAEDGVPDWDPTGDDESNPFVKLPGAEDITGLVF